MSRFPTFATLALVALIGCGGSEEDKFKLVKVTGTITKQGKPLADATVSFVPAASNKNSTPAVETTGAQGDYMLTFKGRAGVAPGKYKVFVTPAIEAASGDPALDELKDQPRMLRKLQVARNEMNKKTIRDAEKAAARSEFDAEIDEQAVDVTLDFNVKSS